MKIKKIWIAAAVLTICIGVLWAANDVNNFENTANSPQSTFIDQKETLKGLQGVNVLIEPLDPEVEKHGLTKQQIQTDVELKLRQNGIKVLSQQEWLSTAGNPFLDVSINMRIRSDSPVVSNSISLKLYQTVVLVRDPTKYCSATTWSTGCFGSGDLVYIQSIRETVKDKVDMFINDYLAVNPKEREAKK